MLQELSDFDLSVTALKLNYTCFVSIIDLLHTFHQCVGLFDFLLAGLHNNYLTGFHESWWEV